MKEFSKITSSVYFKIAVVVIIIAIVYAIYSGVKALINKRDAYSREARQNYSNSKLSFSELEYQNMATRLLDAMSGPGYNMSTITSILSSLQTSDDWYKLVHVFGVKETTAWYSSWSGNLVEWLVDELYESDENEIRTILSNIGVIF